jgi:hypothetical protein
LLFICKNFGVDSFLVVAHFYFVRSVFSEIFFIFVAKYKFKTFTILIQNFFRNIAGLVSSKFSEDGQLREALIASVKENYDAIGCQQLLEKKEKIAFLSSRSTPNTEFSHILSWIDTLNKEETVVICGGHSFAERFTYNKLIERGVSTVLFLERPYVYKNNTAMMNQALEKNQLLILSPKESLGGTSAEIAQARNLAIMKIADKVVVGYVAPKGNLSRQIEAVRDVVVLSQTKDVRPPVKLPIITVNLRYSAIVFEVKEGDDSIYLKISQQKKLKEKKSVRKSLLLNKAEVTAFRDQISAVHHFWRNRKRGGEQEMSVLPEIISNECRLTMDTKDGDKGQFLRILQTRVDEKNKTFTHDVYVNEEEIDLFHNGLNKIIYLMNKR